MAIGKGYYNVNQGVLEICRAHVERGVFQYVLAQIRVVERKFAFVMLILHTCAWCLRIVFRVPHVHIYSVLPVFFAWRAFRMGHTSPYYTPS